MKIYILIRANFYICKKTIYYYSEYLLAINVLNVLHHFLQKGHSLFMIINQTQMSSFNNDLSTLMSTSKNLYL